MMDEIDHQYLLSLGFDNAKIVDPEKTLRQLRSASDKAQVQLLKATLVAGSEHLRFAARNALHSFRSKSPRSKSLAVEFLLYVSCQRQISKAISPTRRSGLESPLLLLDPQYSSRRYDRDSCNISDNFD